MNIHFTSHDPEECAQYLDDVRHRKMMSENFQMFATALGLNNVSKGYYPIKVNGKLYKDQGHKHHLSTLWVAESRENMLWLCDYTQALYERYKRTKGKAFRWIPFNLLRVRQGALKLPSKGLTKKPNCAANDSHGVSYKHIDCINTAYMLYLNDRWDGDKRESTWSGVL